jgi:ribosomal protein L21
MYAVIRTGGKQYRVAPGDVIRVENQGDGSNGKIEFGDVLAVSGEAGQIGKPQSDALVTGEVMEQGRGEKFSSSITSARSNIGSCAVIARDTPRCASPKLLSTASPSKRRSFLRKNPR